jgi:hypothetical protein
MASSRVVAAASHSKAIEIPTPVPRLARPHFCSAI